MTECAAGCNGTKVESRASRYGGLCQPPDIVNKRSVAGVALLLSHRNHEPSYEAPDDG